MNMPLASILRALFTRGGLGYYHPSVHPLPDLVLHNAILIVDLDGDNWWEQLEEGLGNRDVRRTHSYVVEAWNSMGMDDVLAGAKNMSMEEGLLVCHFLELACQRRYLPGKVGGGSDYTLRPNGVAKMVCVVCW